jgi:hypothetical protein
MMGLVDLIEKDWLFYFEKASLFLMIKRGLFKIRKKK